MQIAIFARIYIFVPLEVMFDCKVKSRVAPSEFKRSQHRIGRVLAARTLGWLEGRSGSTVLVDPVRGSVRFEFKLTLVHREKHGGLIPKFKTIRMKNVVE